MEQSDVQIILWLVVGVALIGAEIVIPGFILFPFGLGAMVAAGAGWMGANFVLQFLVFVVVSGVGFVLLRPLGRRLNQMGDQSDIGSGRLIGHPAVVTVAIADGAGMIRVSGEFWRADTADGSALPEGTKVQVVDIKGTRAIVARADPPADSEPDDTAPTEEI